MSQPASQLAELTTSVQDLTISRYVSMAAYCLLFYDLLLTFSTEVSLIWTAPWNLGKVMYFLNRYPVFIEIGAWSAYYFDFSVRDSFCGAMGRSWTWEYILLTIPAQLIVMLRTIAIWNKNKRVRASLILCFGVSLVASLVFNGLVIRSDTFGPVSQVKPILGCMGEIQTGSPKWSIPAWGFQLFYDGLVFFLVVFRSDGELGRSRLMKVIFRDGCLYYLALLATSLLNVTLFAALPANRAGLLTAAPPIQLACMSIMANRIMLNMRDAASGRPQLEFASTWKDVTDIQFAGRSFGTRTDTTSLPTVPPSTDLSSSSGECKPPGLV